MKLVVLFLSLGLFFTPHAFAACSFDRPHSIECQHATFEGEIFPLVNVKNSLGGTWFANQYTAGSRAGEGLFSTQISPSNSKRTCFVRNEDGTRVGALRFGRGVQAQIANLRSDDFRTNRPGGFEDSKTVVFANTSTRQIFKCRIFERANANHLTCQYFEDDQFQGYLGFLKFDQDCR